MKKKKLEEMEKDEKVAAEVLKEFKDVYQSEDDEYDYDYDSDEEDEDDGEYDYGDDGEYGGLIDDDMYADGGEASDGGEKPPSDAKLQEKVAELEDKVKRQMAEFDNFRKRTDKEKAAMFETGAKSVIEKILPVVDNFERGLLGLCEEDMKAPFAEGMNMVYKQLITELEKLDVKPIEALGCEFNPELHNAVMQMESNEYESGFVAQELQKGYTYRDSVVRHSLVAVVN